MENVVKFTLFTSSYAGAGNVVIITLMQFCSLEEMTDEGELKYGSGKIAQ